MPKKKEETTMLVRAVPLEVSERIRRYCRREKIRYRQFLERAIDLFEGGDEEDGQDAPHEQGAEQDFDPIERVKEISKQVKAYKKAIGLRKDIKAIANDIGWLAGLDTQRNAYLELIGMAKALNELFEKYIPKHDIPDDLQAREAMGLPFALACDEPEVHVPSAAEREEARERYEAEMEKLRQEMEKTMKELGIDDIGVKKEEPVEPQMEQPVVAAPDVEPPNPDQDKAKEEPPGQEGKEQIKTARFGRGFDDWVDE